MSTIARTAPELVVAQLTRWRSAAPPSLPCTPFLALHLSTAVHSQTIRQQMSVTSTHGNSYSCDEVENGSRTGGRRCVFESKPEVHAGFGDWEALVLFASCTATIPNR